MRLGEEDGHFFRSIFEAAADAMVVIGEDGAIVLANEACQQLLGHLPASLIGKPVDVLVPSRFLEHPKVRSGYAVPPRARPMGQGLTLVASHADGREVPVDIVLTPLIQDGRHWTVCSIRDMRGRALVPSILRVQATALYSAANGIVITDRSGTISWVNPAASAITGYAPDELIGQHTRLLKSGEHDAAFYANLWRRIMAGETWSGTIVNRRKDGTLYHEEQTITPVVDEDGQVSHFIAIKQDVTERWRDQEALAAAHARLAEHIVEIESLNAQLRETALYDALTGLHNRRFFQEAAGRDVARAIRLSEPLAVVMVDVDDFKDINDAYGHAAGDLVLQALATVLRDGARASDLVCRFGGDELVGILSGASLPVAMERARLWRENIEAMAVEAGDGNTIRCTVSIGVAMLAATDGSIESALRRADGALYEAKRAGRNRVLAAENDDPALAVARDRRGDGRAP